MPRPHTHTTTATAPHTPCPASACRSGLPARQTAILDANDGAGWDLAASLLRPRTVVNDDDGGVKFVNTGRAPRLGASAALKHPFIRRAGVPAAPAAEPPASGSGGRGRGRGGAGSSSADRSGTRGSRGQRSVAAPAAAKGARGGGGGGGLLGMWGSLKSRFFDLEARVMQEATATEVQTTRVQQLRGDVAAGRASAADLLREETALEGMQRSLASSVKEMNSVYGAARGFLSGILGSGGSGKGGKVSRGSGGKAAAADAADAAPERRMPKWAAKEVPLEKVDPAAARQAAAASSPRRQQGEQSEEEEAAAAASAAAEAAGAAAGAVVSSAASSLLVRCGGPPCCCLQPVQPDRHLYPLIAAAPLAVVPPSHHAPSPLRRPPAA